MKRREGGGQEEALRQLLESLEDVWRAARVPLPDPIKISVAPVPQRIRSKERNPPGVGTTQETDLINVDTSGWY